MKNKCFHIRTSSVIPGLKVCTSQPASWERMQQARPLSQWLGLRTRLNNIEYCWIIFTNFNLRIFGNFLICFRKFDWKTTDVTLFWNLARNPDKNHQNFAENMQNSTKKLKKKSEIQLFNRENFLAIFDEKIEIRERCKGVHCVDLGESFPTSTSLENLASIQPRTSPIIS